MASLRARRTQQLEAGVPPRRAPAAGAVSRRQKQRSAAGELLAGFVLVGLIAAMLYLELVWLPRPLAAEEAGRRGFSEERAMSHLKVLASFGPKPVGSHNLDRALEYISHVVEDIRDKANSNVYMEIENFVAEPGANRLQSGLFRGKTLAYADLRHLLVRVSSKLAPDAEENSILVSSHVDTVYTSEGGGDCGSCVSVMLEVIRALSHAAQTFKHSVIFLFNTGEEDGLDGAHSFVTQHDWSSSIRGAIDLEAMGAGGKSQIFQAPDNWLLDIFAQVAKYPSSSILAQDIFHSGLIKSATDFQVYREVGGWSGLDFAYIENGAVYHTRNDAVKLVRPGSLQHLGDNILPLLVEVATSAEMPSSNINTLNHTDAFGAVYFDFLGRFMVTCTKQFARTLYRSTVVQALVLFLGSFIRARPFAAKATIYGVLGLALTWIASFTSAITVAILVAYSTTSSVPYIAYPVLAIGLFGSSALFGAIIGHSAGYFLLHRYLVNSQAPAPHAETERTMFKSTFLHWLLFLALATWKNLGSSYIPFAWLVAPALAYGIIESSFGKELPRQLSMWTLLLGLPVPFALTTGVFTALPSSLIGNLVRFEGNPGTLPPWVGNVLIASMISGIVCFFTTYLLPYIHRGNTRRLLLVLTAGIAITSVVVVSNGLVPAFSKDTGKGTYVVHVVESEESPRSYVSVSFTTPGFFTEEVRPLLKDGFTCGETTGPDFVSFSVKRGCTKPSKLDENLWNERPALKVETDGVVDGRRLTKVLLNTKSSNRWVMAVDADRVDAFGVEILSGSGQTRSLVPLGKMSAAKRKHLMQFASGSNGPRKFRIQLVWLEEINKQTADRPILSLRTDSRNLTSDVVSTLSLLPEWCVLFGKSSSPYNLAYISKLELQ